MADWLGSAVLPPTNAKAGSQRATALSMGHASSTGQPKTWIVEGAITRSSPSPPRRSREITTTAAGRSLRGTAHRRATLLASPIPPLQEAHASSKRRGGKKNSGLTTQAALNHAGRSTRGGGDA